MTRVKVTGNAWDHSRTPIPSTLLPELYAVPTQSNVGPNSLLTDSEVKATLNALTGAFNVNLESYPGVRYRFYLRHLVPGQELELPENRARGYIHWNFEIDPGSGGAIWDLVVPSANLTQVIAYGLGAPPADHPATVPYINLTGTNPALWADTSLIGA